MAVDTMVHTLAAITAHGGRVVRAPYAEGTLQVALFGDPAGNVLGIWQEPADDSDAP